MINLTFRLLQVITLAYRYGGRYVARVFARFERGPLAKSDAMFHVNVIATS